MTPVSTMRVRARTVALAAALLLPFQAIATAQASDASHVEWNPNWRKVGLWQGLALIPLGGALAAIELVWTPPQAPNWIGGIFFDGRIRTVLRSESPETQTAAKKLGDMLFIVGSILPIVVDVGVTLAV